MLDYSRKFYARYANRYAEVSHQFLQSIYIESSHPKLAGDMALIEHLKTPVPDKRGLVSCIGETEKLNDAALHQTVKNKGKVFNSEWVLALGNEVMLRILEMVTRASLLRKESRGALYRTDYPDTDNKDWLKYFFLPSREVRLSRNRASGIPAEQLKYLEIK